ncbi:MAG TPA: glutamine-hydrolyzing carbamoyl-phosphate synthase small subunit [Candidatus Polarisedimenticolia bacterium]|nr:glutamine-hydrolyzing carbamoyl-phosphate synthase small subunit [Candidatus Polarisedimenticolia bacterium]
MHSSRSRNARLVLEDGSEFAGVPFGYPASRAGEVVFNTGMVGYPEALTDPSYSGQILSLTYPLIGNYGIPAQQRDEHLDAAFESDRVQIAGLIVAEFPGNHHHWSATRSLDQWLSEHRVPAVAGIDTRSLTRRLREKGSMLGKILLNDDELPFRDPNDENLVAGVSVSEPLVYEGGDKRVVVVDGGCKHSILRSLLKRGATIIRVPWDYDFLDERFDAVLISSGPGDPKQCSKTISIVERAMSLGRPIFGLCLGHQILALAAGADTYKLKFGHRGQNQPCTAVGTKRCYITSQNHGFAVDDSRLPPGWEPWFSNANDGSNEGIRHRSRPFMSVQFHPEAAPGPVDTNFLFDEFVGLI